MGETGATYKVLLRDANSRGSSLAIRTGSDRFHKPTCRKHNYGKRRVETHSFVQFEEKRTSDINHTRRTEGLGGQPLWMTMLHPAMTVVGSSVIESAHLEENTCLIFPLLSFGSTIERAGEDELNPIQVPPFGTC